MDETPVVTKHSIQVNGKTLNYTATAAQMPLKDASGETEAHIFYVAYTLDGADPGKRPLAFCFNGGPGAASIWVHMGAMGPRSPKLDAQWQYAAASLPDDGQPHTWLDQTDLVFIDPVGTGYSRAKTVEIARRMNSVQGDLQSVGEFIRMYITRNERTLSPLFIAGESYGTFRAAGLAGLPDRSRDRVQRRDPDLGDVEPGDDLVAVRRSGLRLPDMKQRLGDRVGWNRKSGRGVAADTAQESVEARRM